MKTRRSRSVLLILSALLLPYAGIALGQTDARHPSPTQAISPGEISLLNTMLFYLCHGGNLRLSKRIGSCIKMSWTITGKKSGRLKN